MVAEITEKKFAIQHLVPILVKAQVATQNDWVVLEGFKGVIPIQGMAQSVALSLQETFTFGVATVTPTCTALTTSFAVGTATITRVPPYYVITASGEIIEVLAETAPTNAVSTWTVRRGCFGTTASATGLAATNIVGIMNILKAGANTVGPHLWLVLPLPNDPGTKLFE
jgi:hypothetical protein